MNQPQSCAHPQRRSKRKPAAERRTPLKFRTPDDFRNALRNCLDNYFAAAGRRPRDCPQMYVKSAVIFAVCATTYALLLFAVSAWWMALPLSLLLGLSLAAVGFNIQHDGGHGAYSEHRWINKLASLTLDLAGASSYIWARKHNAIHHSYTNVAGHDDDINIGFLGRLSPHQKRIWFHRLQHLYLWILYGFLPMKWHLYDDFRDVIRGRVGEHRIARPRGRELATFIGGKLLFFSLAFLIPMLMHPWWGVLLMYLAATFVQGLVLSVVFQMAHSVEAADFPAEPLPPGSMESTWAVHQVQTTVNFAPENRWITWLVGGLNFQIEHHLFPNISHIHYPGLAPLVRQTCEKFGLRYAAYETLFDAVASHFRWLRRMGTPAAV